MPSDHDADRRLRVDSLSRRGLLYGAAASVMGGVVAVRSHPVFATTADVSRFRDARLGQYGVIRAEGTVSLSASPKGPAWPVRETTLVSWAETVGGLTEHRHRRLQITMSGKILEQTVAEVEFIDVHAGHVLRLAAGRRTLIMPAAALSTTEIDAVSAAPGTADLPEGLSALRVIQDTGPGSVKMLYLTERNFSSGLMGASPQQPLLWRMAGTLTRWADSPASG